MPLITIPQIPHRIHLITNATYQNQTNLSLITYNTPVIIYLNIYQTKSTHYFFVIIFQHFLNNFLLFCQFVKFYVNFLKFYNKSWKIS